MPQLKFKNTAGRTITVNSPDGSMPTEQELDRLFSLSKKPAEKIVEKEASVKARGGQEFSVKDLSRKLIPQLTAGLESSVIGGRGMTERLKIGIAPEDMPEPEGIVPTIARAVGEAAPMFAIAQPAMGAAGLIPKIPAFLKAGVGLGAVSAARSFARNEPVGPAAAKGAVGGMLMHGLGRVGVSIIPKKIPGSERIGSVITGGATGYLMEPDEKKKLASALLYGGLSAKSPAKRLKAPKSVNKYLTSREAPAKRAIKRGGLRSEERIRDLARQSELRREPKIEKIKGIREKISQAETIKKEQTRAEIERINALRQKVSESKAVKKVQTRESIKQQDVKQEKSIAEVETRFKQKVFDLKKLHQERSESGSRAAKEKTRQFRKELSEAYGRKEDEIGQLLEKRNSGISRQEMQEEVLAKTRAEIEKTFITKGKPLSVFENMESKYGSGINPETSPELHNLMKSYGGKKYGIDFKKLVKDTGWKGAKGKTPSDSVNFKELAADVRQMGESLSAKARGAERDISPDDRAAMIFIKNFKTFVNKRVPEYGKLQESYKGLSEQMNFLQRTFKPGSYETKAGTEFIKKTTELEAGGLRLESGEQALLKSIVKGTPEYTKGIGDVMSPARSLAKKIMGTEKSFGVVKEQVKNLSAIEKRKLGQALTKRLADLSKRVTKLDVKESQAKKSLMKRTKGLAAKKAKLDTQEQRVKDDLKKRENELIDRVLDIKAKMAAKHVKTKERNIISGGGAIPVADYLIRRQIANTILKHKDYR